MNSKARCAIDWLHSKVGVSAVVPKPWTPVKIKGDSYSCWGRIYSFAGFPLPAQIVSAGVPLLSHPVSLLLNLGGQEIAWQSLSAVTVNRHANGRSIVRCATGIIGDLFLKSTITLFYDGAMKIDIELAPLRPTRIRQLRVVIPFKLRPELWFFAPWRDKETRIMWGNEVSKSWVERRFDVPYTWASNQDAGLAWFCESDKDWDVSDNALAVRRRDQTLEFVMNIITTARQIEGPLAFSFGLLPNPWRPPEKNYHRFRNFHVNWLYDITDDDLRRLYRQGVRTLIFHSGWTHWHAYPETKYAAQLRSLVKRVHRHGMKLLVYFGVELSSGAPEWTIWGERWRVHPRQKFGYVPYRGPKYEAFHICFNSEWPNFILNGVARLLEKYKLDGVYLDGWTEWGKYCGNPLHGCGYTRVDGSRAVTWPFWKCRELLERVYVIVKSHNPQGRISLHANPGGSVGAHFGTDCFGGEGYAGDFRNASLLHLRALHMGVKSCGVFSEIITYTNHEYGLAAGLLHNILPRPWSESGKRISGLTAAVWKVQDVFNARQTQWLPYWQNSALISGQTEVIKVSVWLHNGKGALFVVANLGVDDSIHELCVPWRKFGLLKKLVVFDFLHTEITPAEITKAGLRLQLPAGQARLLFVGKATIPLTRKMEGCRAWVMKQDWFQTMTLKEDWLVAGPFPATGSDSVYYHPERMNIEVPPEFDGLERVYPPETEKFDADARFLVATGCQQGWRKVVATEGCLTLPPETTRKQWEVVYLYTKINFPLLVPPKDDNLADFSLSTHHAFKVWINGQEVYRHGGVGAPRYGQRPKSENQHKFRVILHPGVNVVLIKLVAREGMDITYKITAPTGQPLPITVSAKA